MQVSDLDQLEQKINRVVSQLKVLTEENLKLKERIGQLEGDASSIHSENTQIRAKIESMIHMIDSIEA